MTKNEKLMRRAGFKKLYPSSSLENGWVWGRGALRIAVDKDMPISLDRLIGWVIESTIYNCRKNVVTTQQNFETTNKKGGE